MEKQVILHCLLSAVETVHYSLVIGG